MTRRYFLLFIAGITIVRLIVASLVPLAPDEAYYWLWSRHLRPGYYDDAPLIALWIKAGTGLIGQSPLGIRLLSPIGAAIGSLLLWRAGDDLFPGRNAGIVAAILLNATLMLNAGAIITTPDTPLLLFWTATIAAVARWHATGDDRWWIAAGIAEGLAFESKYTGVLLFPIVGLWLLMSPAGRAALRRPLPWIGLGFGLLLFAPVIFWNAGHGWVSFAKQGGRSAHLDLSDTLEHLAGLIGGQLGLATPIVAALMAAGVWRAIRDRSTANKLVWLSVVIPGAIFVEHTLSGAVQANWPSILYPGAALAASGAASDMTRKWLPAAVTLGAVITAIVYAQAIAAPIPLPVRHDPTALELAGWPQFAAGVARFAQVRHSAFIAGTDYATVAELAYRRPKSIAVIGVGPRWRYFDLPSLAPNARQSGLLVEPRYLKPQTDGRFHDATLIGALDRRRDHKTIEVYDLYRVELGSAVPNAIVRDAR